MRPIKTHTRKIITAGCLVVQAVYPRRDRRDDEKVRAAKSKASTEAQKRMNQIYSYQKLELILAANFPRAGSGLVVTLSYDDAHLPKTRSACQRRLRYFLKLLREARKKEGLPPPRAVYCTEVLTSGSGRWHHHLVLDSTGRDLELIRRCWIYGSDIEAEPLRVDAEKNHETQARYMSKEPRECQDEIAKPGLHAWSCTRNCLRPSVETEAVDGDASIEPPEGVTVLMDERRQTEWASWRVVKYRIGDGCFQRPPRARRRKRPRRFL